MPAVPVLEIGGTHVTAAAVDVASWSVAGVARRDLDADASAAELVGEFVAAAGGVGAGPGAVWGVAMPDPFDYAGGVAWFEGVGKFAALHGVDVGAGLLAGVRPSPSRVAFVNDADAFTLGEWVAGAAQGAGRCVGLTLGTGVGSGWLVDGRVVDPGTPSGGRAHRLLVDGAPLEDSVSRRAIRRAFAAAGGDPAADVRDIADLARDGDVRAAGVLDTAFAALGRALGPPLAAFAADVLIVGGSMAASWALFEPSVRAGAGTAGLPPVVAAADPDAAPLRGAALHATRG